MDKLQASQILKSRVLIPSAGKYTVKATSVNPFIREDGTATTIVNFNATTAYQLGVAKEAFLAGDYEAAVGKGTSMSTSQLSGQYVPSKGEIVDIEVSDHVNNEGIEILVVSSIVPRKAVKAANLNVDSWLEEEPVAATEEAEAGLV